jgi:hypothetical protein
LATKVPVQVGKLVKLSAAQAPDCKIEETGPAVSSYSWAVQLMVRGYEPSSLAKILRPASELMRSGVPVPASSVADTEVTKKGSAAIVGGQAANPARYAAAEVSRMSKFKAYMTLLSLLTPRATGETRSEFLSAVQTMIMAWLSMARIALITAFAYVRNESQFGPSGTPQIS